MYDTMKRPRVTPAFTNKFSSGVCHSSNSEGSDVTISEFHTIHSPK